MIGTGPTLQQKWFQDWAKLVPAFSVRTSLKVLRKSYRQQGKRGHGDLELEEGPIEIYHVYIQSEMEDTCFN